MRLMAAALILVVAVFAQGCSDEGEVRRVNTIVLLDFSASVQGESFDTYLAVLKTSLLAHLGPRDRVLVRPIDSSSEQRAVNLLALDLAAERLDEDPGLGLAHREERLRELIAKRISKEVAALDDRLKAAKSERTRFGGRTDILGALDAAEPELDRAANSHNLVVLFSDMVQETPDCDLSALKGLGAKGVESLLDRASKHRAFPNLSGVWLFAMGAGEGTADSIEFFRAVKSFWTAYAAKTGARLEPGNYGFRNGERLAALVETLHGTR